LKFQAKVPDKANASKSVNMEFHYGDTFPEQPLPDAYERLLLDAILGDASLFTRSDGIAAEWSVIDPIIRGWENDPQAPPLGRYAKGGWGPEEADELLSRSGHEWLLGCGGH
jgi:glucose-6-phosphate 1-dehydrogenase